MKVISVQVVAVRPEPVDARQLDFLRTERGLAVEDHYYIVKLYLDNPLPSTAEAPRLFVGDEEITRYNGFSAGAFFKVYDSSFFERHRDQPVYFSLRGVRLGAGARMPGKPAPQPQARLLPLAGQPADSLPTADDRPQLPTKAEVLHQ
jgi:hypothetical protein